MLRTVTPIFSIVLAIVIYFGFTDAVFDDIKAIQVEAESYANAIEKGTQYNSAIERNLSLKRSLGALESERLNVFVPSKIDEVHLVVDLEGLARKNSMLLGNLEVSEKTKFLEGDSGRTNSVGIADFSTVDISFGLIGTYEQFRAMLSDIEKSLVLMEVVSIAIEANDGPLQQFDIVVRAYELNTLEQLSEKDDNEEPM